MGSQHRQGLSQDGVVSRGQCEWRQGSQAEGSGKRPGQSEGPADSGEGLGAPSASGGRHWSVMKEVV